jgi:CheY-like chemotaxis protein
VAGVTDQDQSGLGGMPVPDETAFAAALDMAPQALVMATQDGRAVWANRRARALLGLPPGGERDWPGRLPRRDADADAEGGGWRMLPTGGAGATAPFWLWSRVMPAGEAGARRGRFVLHALWPCRPAAGQSGRGESDGFDEFMVAQARHALLGEMGGALAHQMSQPLNIIRLTAERAALEAEGPSTAGADSDDGTRFARLADQAETLFETVSLLQGAPQVSGPGDLEIVDLGKLISRAAHLARGPLRAAGLRPDVVVPPHPLWAWGEPIILLQCLFAVLTVLADTIADEADRAMVGRASSAGSNGSGRGVVIRLGQSGDGLSEGGETGAEGPRLLVDVMSSRTARDAPPLSAVPPDLSISHRLVLAALALVGLGGHLRVLVDDQGALRGVRLDLAGSGPTDGRSTGASDRAGGRAAQAKALGGRVLLADDDRDAADVIAEYLSDEDFAVDVVHDTAAALAALESDPYDVLVTHAALPGAGADRLMRAAEAAHPDMVLVLIAGPELEADPRRAALADMADAVLRKPISLAALHRAVIKALDA